MNKKVRLKTKLPIKKPVIKKKIISMLLTTAALAMSIFIIGYWFLFMGNIVFYQMFIIVSVIFIVVSPILYFMIHSWIEPYIIYLDGIAFPLVSRPNKNKPIFVSFDEIKKIYLCNVVPENRLVMKGLTGDHLVIEDSNDDKYLVNPLHSEEIMDSLKDILGSRWDQLYGGRKKYDF